VPKSDKPIGPRLNLKHIFVSSCQVFSREILFWGLAFLLWQSINWNMTGSTERPKKIGATFNKSRSSDRNQKSEMQIAKNNQAA